MDIHHEEILSFKHGLLFRGGYSAIRTAFCHDFTSNVFAALTSGQKDDNNQHRPELPYNRKDWQLVQNVPANLSEAGIKHRLGRSVGMLS